MCVLLPGKIGPLGASPLSPRASARFGSQGHFQNPFHKGNYSDAEDLLLLAYMRVASGLGALAVWRYMYVCRNLKGSLDCMQSVIDMWQQSVIDTQGSS